MNSQPLAVISVAGSLGREATTSSASHSEAYRIISRRLHYTKHAYTFNICPCRVISGRVHPLKWLNGAVRSVMPHSSRTDVTPPSLPFSLPPPSFLLLFLFFSPHLFIKLMRLKLGPSSQGERERERAKEDTQTSGHTDGGNVSACALGVCAPECVSQQYNNQICTLCASTQALASTEESDSSGGHAALFLSGVTLVKWPIHQQPSMPRYLSVCAAEP